MRRSDFEHVLAAAVNVSGEREIVVLGSQAILGSVPKPPAALAESMELDIYPLNDPAKAEDIDGALGDGSQFHSTYGFYAHGVGPETMKGPAQWQQRLIKVQVPPRPGESDPSIAYCLELHDLVLAKCAANRERDWEYAREMLRLGLVELEVLLERVEEVKVGEEDRKQIRAMLVGLGKQLGLAGGE